jgi:hypothetical protein
MNIVPAQYCDDCYKNAILINLNCTDISVIRNWAKSFHKQFCLNKENKMPIETKIICDNCNQDLSETTNSIDYRLELKNRRIQCHEGAVTDMLIMPAIENNCAFCGLHCLSEWLKKYREGN